MQATHRYAIACLFALLVSTTPAEELSFQAALQQAHERSFLLQQRQATLAGLSSAQLAADALPDPRVFVGIDNLPVNGSDRFSLNNDFMTMRKIGLMQDIPNNNKRHARLEAAKARTAEANADWYLTQATMANQVAVAWLNRYYLGQQITLFSQLEQENQLLTGVVQAQLSTGKSQPVDTLLVAQETLALANRKEELQRDIRKADAILTRWLGNTDGFTLAGNPPAFDIDANTLRLHLPHHPELASYPAQLALATAEMLEAQASTQPDWNVELAWQQRGSAYSNMISLQVSADLPLFTHSRQTPLINAKQQAITSLEAAQQDMLREHQAELEANLADYDALTQQIHRLQQEVIPLAQQKIDLQLASYQASRTDLNTVLASRRELRELQLQAIVLTAQQHMLAARLHYLFSPVGEDSR